MISNPLPEEQRQAATKVILEMNQKLDDDANRLANQAFNLGCMVGLVPAGISAESFQHLARQTLPDEASLCKALPAPPKIKTKK